MDILTLDVRFDQSIDCILATEGVLEVPSQISNFLTRCVLLLDDYIVSVKNLLSEKKKQSEIKRYLKAIEHNKDYFNKNPVWTRYCDTLAAKDTEYIHSIIEGVCKLMKEESKYEWLDSYVKAYLTDIMSTVEKSSKTEILALSYDTLYDWVQTWEEASDQKMQEISYELKHFRLMWNRTKTEKLSQLTIVKLVKSLKAVIKEHVIATMYNLNAFQIASCNMVTEEITKEEIKSIKQSSKWSMKKRLEMEKNSPIIATYHFGDLEIHVHEVPVIKMDSAYNRSGTEVFVDQSFAKYPRAVQKAIIYHEIGHLANGHFGTVDKENDSIDARRMAKQIQKYKWMVQKSPFKEEMDDDELIYILIESEADKYAAKYVGKRTIDTAIMVRMDRDLYSLIPKKKDVVTDQEELLIAFNEERMRFRAALG